MARDGWMLVGPDFWIRPSETPVMANRACQGTTIRVVPRVPVLGKDIERDGSLLRLDERMQTDEDDRISRRVICQPVSHIPIETDT